MAQKRITVFIKMKPYLKAFLISLYGNEPIFFPKTKEAIFVNKIEKLLSKPPHDFSDVIPDEKEEYLEVILPYFKYTNINTKNYLSENSQKIIEEQSDKLFWEAFHDHMLDSFREQISRIRAVVSFIEKYDLPYDDKIEDMLRKSIYRRKKIFSKMPKRKYTKKKSTCMAEKSTNNDN